MFQKISELVNSVNESMAQAQHSESTHEIENRPPSIQAQVQEEKVPLSTSIQNDPQSSESAKSKSYERRLPPNVEAMLRAKREQLANSLNH